MSVTENTKTKSAPVMVAAAGATWGIISLFINPLADAGLSSLQITSLRCFTAACIFVIYLLICGRQYLKIRLRDLWLFIGTGVCSTAFFNVCYFSSMRQNGVSAACVLLYTAPCFVMLMSCILFREKFTVRKLCSLVLAFAGCVLAVGLVESGTSATPAGILIGVCSGFGYALYSIFGKLALKKYGWQTVTTYTFITCAAALVPFCRPAEIVSVLASSPVLIGDALLLTFVSTLTPLLLYTAGLQHMEPGKAAILTFVEPTVAAVIGVTVFGDRFTLLTACGILMILLSIVVLNLREKRTPEA